MKITAVQRSIRTRFGIPTGAVVRRDRGLRIDGVQIGREFPAATAGAHTGTGSATSSASVRVLLVPSAGRMTRRKRRHPSLFCFA